MSPGDDNHMTQTLTPRVKTLEEIDREYLADIKLGRKPSSSKKTDQPRRKRSVPLMIISNLFYLAFIIGIVLAALNFAASNDERKSVLGYRPYFVYSSSMEPELPKGSLIIVKLLTPDEVKVHDYLTYYLPGGVEYRTHEVIEIIPNWQDSGFPGFRTQGINARGPDVDVVPGPMAVGRVDLCIPGAGWVLDWMNQRIYIAAAILAAVCLLLWVIGRVLSRRPSKLERAAAQEGEPAEKKVRRKPRTGAAGDPPSAEVPPLPKYPDTA